MHQDAQYAQNAIKNTDTECFIKMHHDSHKKLSTADTHKKITFTCADTLFETFVTYLNGIT